MLWYVLWLFFVYETPSEHPTISASEKEYIELTAISGYEVCWLPVLQPMVVSIATAADHRAFRSRDTSAKGAFVHQ